jgi:hypothetical protein
MGAVQDASSPRLPSAESAIWNHPLAQRRSRIVIGRDGELAIK